MKFNTAQELLAYYPQASAKFDEDGDCIELNCFYCKDLEELPELPMVTKLNCSYCTLLTSLPELPKMTVLYCFGCDSLASLPELPKVTTLDCSYCALLTSLPELPKMTMLYCFGCVLLISLPELPKVEILYCFGCASLISLPELPKMTKLYCSSCALLVSLPELPKVTELYCSNCALLTFLPELPKVTELDCSNCHLLKDAGRFQSEQVKTWTKKWREQGLMPISKQGMLVFKHVDKNLTGNLQYKYEIGVPFQNNGMACAGPFGAMQDYNLHKEDSYILAIWAKRLTPSNIEKGIYYILEGTPAALYSAKNITEKGADLILVQGVETKEIRSVFE